MLSVAHILAIFHVKNPYIVASAQCMCSTSQDGFIVGQRPSYFPSNIQHGKRSNVCPRFNARVLIHRIHWRQHASEDDAGMSKHAKRPHSVAQAQYTYSTSERLIARQTSSYLTSNAQIVLPRPNAGVVQVCMHLLWVKRPAIDRQTSSYLTPNVQVGEVRLIWAP